MKQAEHQAEPGSTFRGLPLTPEQDSEIRHFIHVRERAGAPWDTPELAAMIADMLDPPELGDEDSQALSASMAAEHGMARDEQDLDGVDERPGVGHPGAHPGSHPA